MGIFDKVRLNLGKPQVREIIKYPSDVLFRETTEVANLDEAIVIIGDLMITAQDLEKRNKGVYGLAAPQIGISKRVFIALGKAFVNPHFTWVTRAPKDTCLEGCFSLEDGKYDYKVERATSVIMKWQDPMDDMNWKEQRFNGLEAQVMQHEMDHLEGRLCSGETAEVIEPVDEPFGSVL